MKNKYAICYSLYDNYNLSETNLYYYKGIIDVLSIMNRNFDIYIDITNYCYNILQKIIQQENLKCNNVYYNIHNQEDLSSGMLWRFKTLIDVCPQYEIIGTHDSDDYFTSKNLEDLFSNNIYGIYTYKYIDIGCWGLIQFFQGGNTYVSYKNLRSNYKKIVDVTHKIYESKIYKTYEFDEFLYTSIFHKEILTNNYGYIITPNILKYEEYHKIDIKKSTFYNLKDNTYQLDDKFLSYSNTKPQATKNDIGANIYKLSKNKNLLFNIQRYMLDYINDLNVKCYE